MRRPLGQSAAKLTCFLISAIMNVFIKISGEHFPGGA